MTADEAWGRIMRRYLGNPMEFAYIDPPDYMILVLDGMVAVEDEEWEAIKDDWGVPS